MPIKLWKPLETADEAIERYATHAAELLDSADERRQAGDVDAYYLRTVQDGQHLTAIAYLLRALKNSEDPDDAAAMVPTLLDPAGPARTWATILAPEETARG